MSSVYLWPQEQVGALECNTEFESVGRQVKRRRIASKRGTGASGSVNLPQLVFSIALFAPISYVARREVPTARGLRESRDQPHNTSAHLCLSGNDYPRLNAHK